VGLAILTPGWGDRPEVRRPPRSASPRESASAIARSLKRRAQPQVKRCTELNWRERLRTQARRGAVINKTVGPTLTDMKILVLNAGSSSHKVSLYQLGESFPDDPPPPLWEAKINWHDHIGADAVEQLLTTLWSGKSPVLRSPGDIDIVGHRIVHGGRQYEEPVRITPTVRAGIAGVSAFAPLHNRGELEVIDVIEKLLGDIPQIAVFDTGFHRNIPPEAAIYPGPYEWFEE